MPVAPIFINIQYNAEKKQKDDLLTIAPHDDGWLVKYDQNTLQRFVTRTLQYAELQPYLLKFFEFLQSDQPSFQPSCVQVDIPSFPIILVGFKDIKSKMPLICEGIFLTSKSWAEEKTVSKPCLSAPAPASALQQAAQTQGIHSYFA